MKRLFALSIIIFFLSGCIGLQKSRSPDDYMKAAEQTRGKISSLTAKATPTSADYVYIVDMSDTSSKKALLSSLAGNLYQAYDADLTTWGAITPSANAQSLVSAATYAAMRTLLDLEAGTDFYSIAAADAAFEGELNNSAGLAAALSDETGTTYSVFSDSPAFSGAVTNSGTYDATITTTTASGETGLYSYITHGTNALTGELIGIRGNARVDTIDSGAGTVMGGKFQAGNMGTGTDLLTATGVYVDVVNKIPSGATAWTNARGYEVSMDLDQGSAGNVNTITNAYMFYGNYNLPTASNYAVVANGYGIWVQNEAVGGTGQMLDAAFYATDKNHSGGIYGWDFGIDFSGIGSNSGGFGTADIRGCNSETIDNNTDGSWNFSAANLLTTGAVGGTSNEIADLYLADGGIIYGQNDQSNTLTSSATGWTANLDIEAATFTVNSNQFDDFLDEDAMGSDSATAVASQQSIKAYVDTEVGTKIGNLSEDTTPQLGGDLDQNGKVIQETSETAFTDSDAPSPDLASAHQLIKFTDDGTTDVDTITGFSNIKTGVFYVVEFVDAYWTIQFSSGNLKGHAGNDWSPRAHDSMVMWTNDGTNINCVISMPTTMPVTQYYEMPFDSTPASDDSWAGPTAEFENGSGGALNQWDLVYLRADGASQEGALYPWDADLATYKYYKPIGIVIESGGIADGATGTVGIGFGIARNDGWTFVTDNTDEGKTVYGTTTAGTIDDVAPAVSGDVVCAVGIALDDDEVQFNFGLCTSTEVP